MAMAQTPLFHVLDITRGTTVDGPGFRTSIYLAGCTHDCEGCHNPQSHSFDGGKVMTLDEILEIVKEEDFNVTLTGGDPLCSPALATTLVKAIRSLGYSVWIYTGFTWEQILNRPELLSVASEAEVVVDGPFVKDLRDTDLLFRGSANQRLIDVSASLTAGEVILFA